MEQFRIDEIARRLLESVPPAFRSMQQDLETNFRVGAALEPGKLDVVTRDEFDTQIKVLERTRGKLEALEKKVKSWKAGRSEPARRSRRQTEIHFERLHHECGSPCSAGRPKSHAAFPGSVTEVCMDVARIMSRAQVGCMRRSFTSKCISGSGLPSSPIVGLAATAVKESKERVRSALVNSKFEFPAGRITVNLAPADVPKEGGRFDLPIALGVLVASGQLKVPGRSSVFAWASRSTASSRSAASSKPARECCWHRFMQRSRPRDRRTRGRCGRSLYCRQEPSARGDELARRMRTH